MRSLPWLVAASLLLLLAGAAGRGRKRRALKALPPPGPGHRPNPRAGERGHGMPADGAAPAGGACTRSLLVGLLHDQCLSLKVDALASGADPRRQAEALASAWHIHTAGEARGTLAWLLEEGHRALYPQVCRILFAVPRAERERQIVLLDDVFDPVHLALCVDNLERAMPALRASRFVASGADLARGVLAWDMGRAIHVARLAYDCGMQNEAQAWAVIERAAAMVFAHLESWEAVAGSYLLGRAMWGGPGTGLKRHLSFGQRCLDDPASPWRAVPYRAAPPRA